MLGSSPSRANPANLPDLERVRRLVGDRFASHPFALSDHEGFATLRIPVVGFPARPL